MELFEQIQNDLANKTFEDIMTENLKNFWGYPIEANFSFRELKEKFERETFNEFAQNFSYFERNILDMQKNIERYKKIYELLQDSTSKKVFVSMMAAKLYMDLEYCDQAYTAERLYFSKNIFSFEDEVYVDCGGYDGNTAVDFITVAPHTSKVYVFEGMPELAEKCRRKTAEVMSETEFIVLPKAVYDHPCRLSFWSGSSTGESKISDVGTVSVEATTLDTEIQERVTFIKMDIEGSEKQAIQGAKNIIKEFTPKMAICIYHLEDDFWKIPEMILSINPNYRFLIRQHEPSCLSETVLYCIPNNMKSALGEKYTLSKIEQDLVAYQQSRAWYIRQLRIKNISIEEQANLIDELRLWTIQLTEAKKFLENTLEQHKEIIIDLERQINRVDDNVES